MAHRRHNNRGNTACPIVVPLGEDAKKERVSVETRSGMDVLDLDFGDGSGAGTLVAGLNRKFHAVAFVQVLEPIARNGRVMHEHITLTIFRRDEAKALFGVKKLYSTRDTVTHVGLPNYEKNGGSRDPTSLHYTALLGTTNDRSGYARYERQQQVTVPYYIMTLVSVKCPFLGQTEL